MTIDENVLLKTTAFLFYICLMQLYKDSLATIIFDCLIKKCLTLAWSFIIDALENCSEMSLFSILNSYEKSYLICCLELYLQKRPMASKEAVEVMIFYTMVYYHLIGVFLGFINVMQSLYPYIM